MRVPSASQIPDFWKRGKKPCLNWDAAVSDSTVKREHTKRHTRMSLQDSVLNPCLNQVKD
ncbi:unnamed protein product [Penicillium roqueforti FM164]|uniref:Uncharacterized protein n=1 Tax=Penicillium roqueforti (strain FM164) TaxID=1365484 RepID=W6R786_PENRF|nr:unnamed protein product [Penicillium roqueforti FM164]